MKSSFSSQRRALAWDGCLNVRDLGGLPTEGGGETRFGVVVRADNVTRLSEAGWRALEEYGVRRVVDLRMQGEREADPPHDGCVEAIHIQLLDPAFVGEVDDALADLDDPREWRVRNYLMMLERYPDRFARAIAVVADLPDGAALVHCAGGVDRTGLVSALLLRLAGVPVREIAADYALSEASWAHSVQSWIDDAPDEQERRKRRLLAVMPAEVMADVLKELERSHGGVEGYLRKGGLTDEQLDRVRARLLD